MARRLPRRPVTTGHGGISAVRVDANVMPLGATEKGNKMAQYQKKPVVIEATQWFKNGDHPKDGTDTFKGGKYKGEKYEGLVVRYYRTPALDGQNKCKHCGDIMHKHGWIDTLEGGHIVCPGDWIITGVQGERYPCNPDIFAATYEEA